MSRSKRGHNHSQGPAQKAESKQFELEKIRNFPTPVGQFEYDRHRYRFDVLVTGTIGTAVMVVGLFMMLQNVWGVPALLMAVVGGYTAFNTYIAKCYPRVVTLDDDSISFTSFGRTVTYRLSEIKKFQVRDNRNSLNMYLRINGGGATSGRYFINCGDMIDEAGERAQVLYVYLLVMEARIDPDNVRTGARHLTDLIADLHKGQPR